METQKEYYIRKLIQCGYSYINAQLTYYSFLRELSLEDLDEYIAQLEKDLCG